MTNDNGINDVVTDQEILSQVKFVLRITDTNEHDTLILQFINDGVRLLRNNFSLIPLIARLQIDPLTHSVKLPKGFYELNGSNPIRTFNNSDNVNHGALAPSAVVDGFYKGSFSPCLSAKVVGGYIYFGSETTDNMCEIAFLGLNVDSNGNLQIPRIADLCVRYFTIAEMCLMLPDKGEQYALYQKRFKEQKRYVRGEYAKSDSQDDKGVEEGYNKFNFNTNGGYW